MNIDIKNDDIAIFQGHSGEGKGLYAALWAAMQSVRGRHVVVLDANTSGAFMQKTLNTFTGLLGGEDAQNQVDLWAINPDPTELLDVLSKFALHSSETELKQLSIVIDGFPLMIERDPTVNDKLNRIVEQLQQEGVRFCVTKQLRRNGMKYNASSDAEKMKRNLKDAKERVEECMELLEESFIAHRKLMEDIENKKRGIQWER